MLKKFISYKKAISSYKKRLLKAVLKRLSWLEKQLKRSPLISLGVLLGLLLIVLIISSRLRAPEPAAELPEPVYAVETFSIGQAPTISAQARVEKTGIVTISAQTAGVVSKIRVQPGQQVSAFSPVVSLASTYTGASIPGIQRQVAQKQHQSVVNTYDTQKSLIDTQREIAKKTDANADELRDISKKSISETESLIALNESIIDTLDTTIATSGSTSTVEAAKQAKSSYLSATNALRQSLRATQYQTDDNKPPVALSNLQKDVLLKQLDLQQQALDLNKEISHLQYKLARAQESLMYPSTPFSGSIERVYVREGQQVSPGDRLATLYCDIKETQLLVSLPAATAENVSFLEPSIVLLGNQRVELYPEYVSAVATDGQLRSVLYSLPQEYSSLVTEQGFVRITIPLGSADTTALLPFIPLSAVHQNELTTEVFVVDGDVARAKIVTIGIVQGNFVEVTAGLTAGDQIIIDRTVVDGVRVTTE